MSFIDVLFRPSLKAGGSGQQNNQRLFEMAQSIIHELYGPHATFRDGQYEAIEAVMSRRRTLVVQKTGWGKSLVYFVCTKLMQEQNRGMTMVVSPLLVLMQNQLEAAEKLGLRCDILNSRTKERRRDILWDMENNRLDLVLVTPETLFAADIQEHLRNIKIGLFVIDEAHCISDWGHDFRLEYGKLNQVIRTLPPTVPVLATTATANDRVIADLKHQMGEDVYVSRGPLTRESLSIQVLHMPSKAERYAWILQNIHRLHGSGIIYCLTQRDCDYLADFLKKNGVPAEAYYSRDGEEGEKQNQEIEQRFQRNAIKAIVATIKLGMGYDKGDIAFVIHFQMPANIVSYYQQIGRAGRSIPQAYAFLMCGEEDERILNYFIDTAFPKKSETDAIMNLVRNSDGMKLGQLAAELNIRRNRMQKAIDFLQQDGYVRKDGTLYYATAKPYRYQEAHYAAISAVRRQEMERMKELAVTKECYSQFVARSLDDPAAAPCGRCSNCLGRELLPSEIDLWHKTRAAEYLNTLVMEIEPRRMWVLSSVTEQKRIRLVNQPGICLAKYGDAGYGELVKRDKYLGFGKFCDELVGKSANVLGPIVKQNHITHICSVPSVRSEIVEDFARRLAERLGLEYVSLLKKVPTRPQKEMENSAFQCANAFVSFHVIPGRDMPQRVLLVDDVVDSRWTMTVCGYRLMEAGCAEVYPFALADSSQKEM